MRGTVSVFVVTLLERSYKPPGSGNSSTASKKSCSRCTFGASIVHVRVSAGVILVGGGPGGGAFHLGLPIGGAFGGTCVVSIVLDGVDAARFRLGAGIGAGIRTGCIMGAVLSCSGGSVPVLCGCGSGAAIPVRDLSDA